MNIKKAAADDIWLAEKGTYRIVKKPDGSRSANMSCPGCGQVASLSNHEIKSDGSVTPSVVCPFDCGFHEFVILDDWEKDGKL